MAIFLYHFRKIVNVIFFKLKKIYPMALSRECFIVSLFIFDAQNSIFFWLAQFILLYFLVISLFSVDLVLI